MFQYSHSIRKRVIIHFNVVDYRLCHKKYLQNLITVFFIPVSQYSCEAKTEYGTRKSKLGVLAYSQSDLRLPGVLSQTINFVTQVFI